MSARTYCPKCGKPYDSVQYTEHHILPKRFFAGSHARIDLCRGCHDKLEERIPLKKKLPRSFYFLVVNNFLGFERVFDPELKGGL